MRTEDEHFDLTAEAVLAGGILVGFLLGLALITVAMLLKGYMS
jgi:hypothetical protein